MNHLICGYVLCVWWWMLCDGCLMFGVWCSFGWIVVSNSKNLFWLITSFIMNAQVLCLDDWCWIFLQYNVMMCIVLSGRWWVNYHNLFYLNFFTTDSRIIKDLIKCFIIKTHKITRMAECDTFRCFDWEINVSMLGCFLLYNVYCNGWIVESFNRWSDVFNREINT